MGLNKTGKRGERREERGEGARTTKVATKVATKGKMGGQDAEGVAMAAMLDGRCRLVLGLTRERLERALERGGRAGGSEAERPERGIGHAERMGHIAAECGR
jgi:hypothetical protein